MLSEQEKREMLQDARSKERRDSFRFAKDKIKEKPLTLDEYIKFLNDIQKIFGPFPISRKPTPTKFNKL